MIVHCGPVPVGLFEQPRFNIALRVVRPAGRLHILRFVPRNAELYVYDFVGGDVFALVGKAVHSAVSRALDQDILP